MEKDQRLQQEVRGLYEGKDKVRNPTPREAGANDGSGSVSSAIKKDLSPAEFLDSRFGKITVSEMAHLNPKRVKVLAEKLFKELKDAGYDKKHFDISVEGIERFIKAKLRENEIELKQESSKLGQSKSENYQGPLNRPQP